MVDRVVLAGLVRTAGERIYQSDSTALSLNSTTLAAGGGFLRLSVESGDCRIFFDAAAALTPTTGVLYQKDSVYEFVGFNDTGFRVIHNTGEAATVINVERYKFVGEG